MMTGPRIAKLLDKAKTLPRKSGCYLMKSKSADVLYVGKAKDLKSRVSSYFQAGAKSPKTEILVSKIEDFDFQMTANESEALVLENNLIKKFAPKYNIMMRDDKSYPYVVVDHSEEFPRPVYKRRVQRGGNLEVFGPFVHGSNISEILRILIKSFRLRDCTLRDFLSRKEPCLLYQMNQCTAPCVGYIDKENYLKDLELALGILRGEPSKSLAELERRMHECAENEEFERAALYRDTLEKLQEFVDFAKQKNAEVDFPEQNVDVIAYHQGEIEVDLAIYVVRGGILLGHKNFHFPVVDMNDDLDQEVMSYLMQYYVGGHDSLPKHVIMNIDDSQALKTFSQGLTSATGEAIKVRTPGRKFAGLFELTKNQAYEHQRVRITNEDSVYIALAKLKELLGLRERPVRLECYDVAIWQGSSPTASQVVFLDGKPAKKDYRHYYLEERPEGNNDFAMMKELLRRRLDNGNLPDVLIVDGGKAQVSMFLEVLKELKMQIPVVGIAKSKVQKGVKTFKEIEVERSEERLIIPGRANPFILSKHKALYKLVTSMRDEAHRFSRRLHHHAEKKRQIKSWVSEVKGLNEEVRAEILRLNTWSLDELSEFNVDELSRAFGVSTRQARALWEYFKSRDPN